MVVINFEDFHQDRLGKRLGLSSDDKISLDSLTKNIEMLSNLFNPNYEHSPLEELALDIGSEFLKYSVL